ncbi:MAG: response regulator [Candidatus Thermoplasmatota archaeon]|nr:response regulator [Candidatus Thermoplasmatota archaeon]MBU1941789.1 response regulator [Candidatus Thermoplasmatota archaeon]
MTRKIMIVDDDPDILVTLRMFFEGNNFEVLAVDSGKDCIRELEEGFTGIVLLDITMPFMDGWATLREIIKRGLNKQVMISIITANVCSQNDQGPDITSYVNEVIAKPFNLERLMTYVRKKNT